MIQFALSVNLCVAETVCFDEKLVWWLWEETDYQEVVKLNLGSTIYHFTRLFVGKIVLFEKDENK